jgi:hypothetical protein
MWNLYPCFENCVEALTFQGKNSFHYRKVSQGTRSMTAYAAVLAWGKFNLTSSSSSTLANP